jgi:hypothetical protein
MNNGSKKILLIGVAVIVFVVTLVAVTPAATATETLEPTAEPTPTDPPAELPTPTAEPTMDPGHDTTAWHAPTLFHDHGANPADAHPALAAAMAEYWTQEIGSAWQSSEHENMFPDGAHAGFTNLSETATGCPQFNGEQGDLCIDAYFMQVHALGTNAHGRVDVHSFKAALWVCNQSGSQCGSVLTGGVHDYLWTHSPYKDYFCKDAGGNPDPVIPTEYQFQVPYVGLATFHLNNGNNRIFWNSLGPTPVTHDEVLAQRGYLPNRGLQIAWAELDAWDYAAGDSPACADSANDTRRCPDGSTDATCADNGNRFQVYTIRMELPEARPFAGWTDRHGNIVEGCEAEGPDCVPLIISDGVPQGRAFLSRRVGPQYAPTLNFDDGTPQKAPPFMLED